MTYIDYIHVYKVFMVSNNISEDTETQDKGLYNLLFRNMGRNSGKCQNPDKIKS